MGDSGGGELDHENEVVLKLPHGSPETQEMRRREDGSIQPAPTRPDTLLTRIIKKRIKSSLERVYTCG